MLPDLQKTFTYADNDRPQFSLPINSYINKLTNHHCVTTKSNFVGAAFWGMSDIHQCSVDLDMAVAALNKQPLGWTSPNDWLLLLSIDLATFCDQEGFISAQLEI